MKSFENAEACLTKAQRARKSAGALLEQCDAEAACNRAYYAMFYAAHVPLIGTPDASFKTHRALIAAFGKQAVVAAKMDPELGRAINQVQQLRQLADYTGDAPPIAEVQWAVAKATTFVAAMQASIARTPMS